MFSFQITQPVEGTSESQGVRLSSRSSSISQCNVNENDSESLRPRCQSVPSPPPRSRKNISQIHESLLDNSLRGNETSASLRQSTSSNLSTTIIKSQRLSYHQQVITQNTINYSVHSTRPPESPTAEEEVPILIDCTMATPVMAKLPVTQKPKRSHSASRLPSQTSLSLPQQKNPNEKHSGLPPETRNV